MESWTAPFWCYPFVLISFITRKNLVENPSIEPRCLGIHCPTTLQHSPQHVAFSSNCRMGGLLYLLSGGNIYLLND